MDAYGTWMHNIISGGLPNVFHSKRCLNGALGGFKIADTTPADGYIRSQLALSGIAGNSDNFITSFGGFPGGPSGKHGSPQSEKQKHRLSNTYRDLGISKLRKALSLSSHAFLRVQIGLSVIVGLVVGGLNLGGTYLFLWRDKKWLGSILVLNSFLTLISFGGWLLGYIG